MSYAVPASTGPKRRPGGVAAAGYLLFLAAVLLIVYAILPLPSMSKIVDATRAAYAAAGSTQPTPDQAASGAQVGLVIVVVVAVIFAVLFTVIGALVLRSNRVGRILAWVFCGLGALCTLCLAGGNLVSGSVSGSKINGVDMTAINNKIAAAAPSWLRPTQAALVIIVLIALILVIILLALPASNAFFRKEPEAIIVNDPAFPSTPYPPSAPPSGFPPPGNPPPGNPPSGNPPSA